MLDLGDEGCFIGAAVRGRGHKQDGVYCDDAYAFVDVAGWRVVIAADGAGSAPFSRVGARLVCEAARTSLERDLANADLTAHSLSDSNVAELQQEPEKDSVLAKACMAIEVAFVEAHRAIADWVAKQNVDEDPVCANRRWVDSQFRNIAKEREARCDPQLRDAPLRLLERDCNTTLLVAAYNTVALTKSDGTRPRMGLVLSCSVGDGMMVAFRRPGEVPNAISLMDPDAGLYAGQTQFVDHNTVSRESLRRRRKLLFLGAASSVVAVGAMTDGLSDDYSERDTGLKRLYCDLILNGVLTPPGISEGSSDPASCSVASQMTVHEEIFEAAAAAGAKSRTIPIRYSGRYLQAQNIGAQELLSNSTLLYSIASQEPPFTEHGCQVFNTAERLRWWLDVYVVKGNFDDRTLVMYQTRGG